MNKISMEKETEKELLQEVENLKAQVKKLKARKKYGLVWDAEKEPEKVVLDCRKKLPILVEEKEKEIMGKEGEPVNLLIKGDNYHSLTALNYTHKGKIDLIYIDPPYNQGKAKEWLYNDHFVDSNDNYRHSKWLNLMEKRLTLAKNLLSNQGLIFISIDDYEVGTLKLLCDEIFGENNFFANLTWINRTKPKNMGEARFNIQQNVEYVLVYGKNNMSCFSRFVLRELAGKKYPYKDDEGKNYRLELISQRKNVGRLRRDTMLFPVLGINPRDGFRWQMSKEKYSSLKENNRIKIIDSKLYELIYDFEEESFSYSPYWSHLLDAGTAEDGKKQLSDALGKSHEFETVKPINLIKEILFHYPFKKEGGIVLDFFAGSGTTGQAIAELNQKDGVKRKFILCTNNEGDIFDNICYPRLKNIFEKQKNNLISGNIKCYKTDFVETENLDNATDQDKIELTYKIGEMIAMREETFEEIEKDDWWQIFSNGKEVTAIYFKEDKSKLQKLVEKLDKMCKKANLYIFSWGKNEYANEFTEYKKIKVKDIPEPLIEVYKEVANI